MSDPEDDIVKTRRSIIQSKASSDSRKTWENQLKAEAMRRGSVCATKPSKYLPPSNKKESIISVGAATPSIKDFAQEISERRNTFMKSERSKNMKKISQMNAPSKVLDTAKGSHHVHILERESRRKLSEKKSSHAIANRLKSAERISQGLKKLSATQCQRNVEEKRPVLDGIAEFQPSSSSSSSITSLEHTISELNFRISDADFSQLQYRVGLKEVLIHGYRGEYMTSKEFETVANKLYKCCLKSVTDLHELHLRRVLALTILKDLINRADPEYISPAHIIHLVWSVMSCLHHFQLRLKSMSNRLVMYNRQTKVTKCMDYYNQLIELFDPKMHRIILSSIIMFYKDGNLWEIDFACTDLVVRLLKLYDDIEEGINDLLNSAIYCTSANIIQAQALVQVIYETLLKLKWLGVSKNLMDRFIMLLETSVSPAENYVDHELYAPLKIGFELCLQNLMKNMPNDDVLAMLKKLVKKMVGESVNEEMMLSFGTLACFAAKKYEIVTFYNSITSDFLYNLLYLTHTGDRLTFLITTKIWLNLIDMHNNINMLKQPKIFFFNCNYGLKKRKKCGRKDRLFFKNHRIYFYDLIVDSFRHCTSRIQMNALFEVCALTLLEIPCGYSAATFTAVAMSMQAHALKVSAENLVLSHYMHATALSILSLICYIHKAEVFYGYVNHIIDRRAEWAPHLIPPLQNKYVYARHHILWNKPELFFEDWETRYGLFKCFRIKKKRRNKEGENKE